MGAVEHHGRDLGGIAVHIGARIAAAAEPGEILVSNAVRESETGTGFRFEDRGRHELKGVPDEWRLFSLRNLPAVTAFRTGRWFRELTTRQARIGLASILGILLVTMGVWVIRSRSQGSTSSDSQALANTTPAIAVLPFRVQGGEEAAVLREGIVDLLSTGLDEAGAVRAISPATLLARWREAVSEGEEPELSTRLQIARQTGSRYAVVGSAIAVESRVRLIASVYDLRTGQQLGQGQTEGPESSILQLVDGLAVEILRIILERGEEKLPEIRLATLTTDSPEALRAYLEGEVHFRHFDLQAAEEAFKRAVDADSMFGLAHYRLADTYLWPTAPGGDPNYHLERALALSDRLPAEERVLVKGLYASKRRSTEAIGSLHELVERHPENAEAWYLLADTYLHVPGAFATAEEIARMFERASKLDPKNAKYLLHHVQFAWWQEADSATAARRLEIFEQAAPRHPLGPAGHLAIALAFGDSISQRDGRSRLQQEDDFEVIADVRRLLFHPRYVALPYVLQEHSRLADDPERDWFVGTRNGLLFWYYAMWHGQLRRALSHIEQLPSTYDPWRAELFYTAKLAGLPISHEQLQAFARIDSTAETWQLYFGGALAADDRDWPNHSRAIAEFERRKERALQESDSLTAESRQNAVEALQAYGLWRRGDPASALPTLSDPRRLGPGQYFSWRLAQVYQELGRLRDAEQVYNSFHFQEDALALEPLAQSQLGKIYEALDEHDKAIQSYEYFIEHWENADAELQSMVEDARQAVIRIRGLRRE